jgi:hypothetical protein
MVECEIYKTRKEKIRELDAMDRDRERFRTMDPMTKENGAVEDLDECPRCREKGKISAMNDFGADFEQTTHYHRCGICGLRLPSDPNAAYKGTFVCSDLGNKGNGELRIYKHFSDVVIRKISVPINAEEVVE